MKTHMMILAFIFTLASPAFAQTYTKISDTSAREDVVFSTVRDMDELVKIREDQAKKLADTDAKISELKALGLKTSAELQTEKPVE